MGSGLEKPQLVDVDCACYVSFELKEERACWEISVVKSSC